MKRAKRLTRKEKRKKFSTVKDWLKYKKANRNRPPGVGKQPVSAEDEK